MKTLPLLSLIFGMQLTATANPALILLPREVSWGEGSYLLSREVKVSTADAVDVAYLFPFIPVGDTTGLRDSSKLIPQ